jgi:hypothetical protein
MGRVRTHIRVGDRRFWTLFDSGSERSYVTSEVARGLPTQKLRKRISARIGGELHRIQEVATLQTYVEGKYMVFDAYVLNFLGVDRKARRPIDILFGAHDMQLWGIELDLKREKLDLSFYSRDFVEF